MTTITFTNNGAAIDVEYKTGNRHSYLNVWRGGVQVSEQEIFHHVPEYEKEEHLRAAALQACQDYDRIMAEMAEDDQCQ